MNNFLKTLQKSQTDVTKQITSPPTLAMHNDGNLYHKSAGVVTPLGAVVEVILLGVYPSEPFVNLRKYFDVPYDPSSKEHPPPVCSSPNGVVPYPNVPNQQATSCAECPWSKPGSGGTEKAQKCSSVKAVWMVFSKTPKMEPFMMQVSVTSLKSLSAYIRESQINEIDLGAGETVTVPMAVYKCQVTRDLETTAYAKPKFVFTGLYLENEVDCVHTTQLALKFDREESLQLVAPPQPVQIAAPAAETPLVEASTHDTETLEPVVLNRQIFPDKPVALGINSAFHSLKDIITSALAVNDVFKDSANVTLWSQCSTEEQADLTALFNQMVQQAQTSPKPEVITPVETEITPDKVVQQLFSSVGDKSELSSLLTRIALCDKDSIKGFLPAFKRTAEKLNGVVYDPATHGSSSLPGMRSYPAMCKNGDYKAKRNTAGTSLSQPPDNVSPSSAIGNVPTPGGTPNPPSIAPPPVNASTLLPGNAITSPPGASSALDKILGRLQNLN